MTGEGNVLCNMPFRALAKYGFYIILAERKVGQQQLQQCDCFPAAYLVDRSPWRRVTCREILVALNLFLLMYEVAASKNIVEDFGQISFGAKIDLSQGFPAHRKTASVF